MFLTVLTSQIGHCQKRSNSVITNDNWRHIESIPERITGLQIRPDVIHTIPTQELLDSCVNFPYLFNFYLYGRDQHAFELLTDEFNGLKELLNRNDAFIYIYNRMENFPNDFECIKKEDNVGKGRFSLQTLFVEYLLIQDAVFTQIEDGMMDSLISVIEKNLEIIHNNPLIFGSVHDVPISMAISRMNRIRGKNLSLKSSGNGYSNTIIYTPNGTPVSALIATQEHNTNDSLMIIAEMATKYSQAEIIDGPTKKYNCHAYAWHVSEGGNKVWLNRPNESNYWSDGSYMEVPESIATKVSYLGDHSAIRISSNEYISKWGNGALVRHAPNYVPVSYSSPNKYYVRTPQIRGSVILCSSNTYYLENSIAGCYTIWSLSGSEASNFTIQNNTPSTGQCTITRNSGASFSNTHFSLTLTASIYSSGSLIKTLTKNLTGNTGFNCTYQQDAGTDYSSYPPVNFPATPETNLTNPNATYVYAGSTVRLKSGYFWGKDVTFSGPYDNSYFIGRDEIRFIMSSTASTSNPVIITVHEMGCDDEVQMTFYPKTYSPYYSIGLTALDEQIYQVSLIKDELPSWKISWDNYTNTTTETPDYPEWGLEIVNATTGKVILSEILREPNYIVNAKRWDSGLYIIRASIDKKDIFNEKINIKK